MRDAQNKRLIQSQDFSRTADALLSNLADTGRGRKQALSVAADSAVVLFSIWIAYSLRFGELYSDFQSTWHLFLALPLVTTAIFSGLGIYRWVVRSTNHRLFKQLFKASLVSALVLVLLTFLFPSERANARSIFIIYGMLLLTGTVGIRLVWQGLFDSDDMGQPVAIYGAGQAGQELVSLLSVGKEYRPVLFLDDNAALGHSTVSGIPVVNPKLSDLKSELRRYDVNQIVLAMPSISANVYQQKFNELEPLGFPIQTMPGVSELLSGSARADQIRDVSIKDILGRTEVAQNVELMGRRVTGKTVLVTGGGGSIGSELCRQIGKLGPAKLIVVDNSEANLYHITEDLSRVGGYFCNQKSSGAFVPLLGSVAEPDWVESLFDEYRIDCVFHAAAYKHVPIVEAQPDQGIKVNIFGTKNVLDAAISRSVSDFVLISTDKAVRPTNAMGATKRIAELLLQAAAHKNGPTRISMVRFGNVLDSSGSVVPKFKNQILEGGPITLTHIDVTRYFMTIPEASQLVLQASAIAKGGEVFVLDMGEPMRIEDLATTMVRLYGKKLQRDTGNPKDIDIVVEGLRPGEKMYEELFITNRHRQTEAEKIFAADENWLDENQLASALAGLASDSLNSDVEALRENLLNLAFLRFHQKQEKKSYSKGVKVTA